MADCYTCELAARRERNKAPLWDDVYRTDLWFLAHAYNTKLPGWMVLVPRRHVESIGELTADEAAQLGHLLRSVSQALKQTTNCAKTYVMQFAEHPQHPHVHFHVVPRMADQPPEYKGPRIFDYNKGTTDETRVSEAEMNALCEKIRAAMVALAG